jgi:two-component system, cell cycle sensor histidine kinase and response regulator CckA
MNDVNQFTPKSPSLRSLAENTLLAPHFTTRPSLTPEDSQRLIHELQVHQIELEMQNEELQRARQETEKSLQRYSDLYDSAPVGYFTLTVDGAITAVNLSGATLFGVPRGQLIGQRFAQFVATGSRPAFLAFLDRTSGSSTKQACDLEIRPKGSGALYVQIEAMAAGSRLECRFALIDITGRRLMESQLLESESHYRLLTEEVSDVVWKTDREHRVTYISPADLRLRGFRADEVIGCTADEMMSDEGKRAFSKIVRQRRDSELTGAPSGTLCFEIQQRCKNGTAIWTEIISTPERGADGAITGYHGISREITGRKQAARLTQQLMQAQKAESLGVLAGGVAHDFNNILMAIFGNADLALFHLDQDSPVAEHLRRGQQAAARAAGLTKQMLAYSGKGKFIIEELDLRRLLEDSLQLLASSVSKKAALRVNLPEQLPAVVADASQLSQVITNLVVNASEAIGEAGGMISIAAHALECSRSCLQEIWYAEGLAEGRYVCLEVADTGCGMDQETVARLFDPFFSTKFTGRGLGMSAVQGIVKGHKGVIRVVSEPGAGTTVQVLLPAGAATAAVHQPELTAAAADDWTGSGSVLIVDDEESVRGVGVAMLEALGFTPISARNGRQALSKFKANPGIVFVLLDLTMPVMDGEQCFRKLRQLDSGVKVIMASGYHEQEVTPKFAGEGMSGFLQKPYSLAELRSTVRRCLQAEGPVED